MEERGDIIFRNLLDHVIRLEELLNQAGLLGMSPCSFALSQMFWANI